MFDMISLREVSLSSERLNSSTEERNSDAKNRSDGLALLGMRATVQLEALFANVLF